MEDLMALCNKKHFPLVFQKRHWLDHPLGSEFLTADWNYPHCKWTIELPQDYRVEFAKAYSMVFTAIQQFHKP